MSKITPKNNEQNAVPEDSETIAPISKIPEFIKNNPFLALLNAGLIIGGLLAYTFFAKIEYLPEFDLQNATTLLIGVALVGIGVTVGLIICLLLPGMVIQNIWRLMYPPIEDNELDKENLNEVRRQHSFALIISSTLIGIIVIVEWILILSIWTHFDLNLLLISIGLLIALAIIQTSRYKKSRSRYSNEWIEKIYGNKSTFIYSSLGLVIAWIIPGFILILILFKPFENFYRNQSWFGIGLLIVTLTMIVVNNSMLAAGHLRHKPKSKLFFQAYIAAIFSCLMLYISLPSNQTNLINVPFQILHLGNISNTVFVVKDETCNMLNTLKPASCLKQDGLGCVKPKRVASRIGTEFLLIFDGIVINSKIQELSIPLKKEDVLGWSFGNESFPEACKKIVPH